MDDLILLLIGLAVLFFVFLILREFNAWYWKINERINLQQKQISILEKILFELKGNQKPTPKAKQKPKRGSDWKTVSEVFSEIDEKNNKISD